LSILHVYAFAPHGTTVMSNMKDVTCILRKVCVILSRLHMFT